MLLRHQLLFVLLMVVHLIAWGRSRIADTEISSVDGVPCFTISLAEERRNGQPLLGALSVADLTDKPATGVWSFLMTGGEKCRSHQKAVFCMVISLKARRQWKACLPLNCKQEGSTAYSSMEGQMILPIQPMAIGGNFA